MTIQQMLSRTGLLLNTDGTAGSAAPSPSSSQAAGQTGGGQVPSISLSREEYDSLVATKAKYGELETNHKTLSENWSHAQRLIRNEGTPEELQGSTRQVLKASGWTDERINAYLAQSQDEEAPAPKGGGQKKGNAARGSEGEGEEESDLTRMQADLDRLNKQIGQQEGHRLREMWKGAVSNAVDTTKEVGTVMELLVKLAAPEDQGKRAEYQKNLRETVMAEVDREFRHLLSVRRSQSGNGWSDAWVPDAAAAAAKAVAGKYQRLVPDPSRLQRVGETGVGDDYITSTTPVAAPTFKKGDRMSDVEARAQAYTVDALLRGDRAMKV